MLHPKLVSYLIAEVIAERKELITVLHSGQKYSGSKVLSLLLFLMLIGINLQKSTKYMMEYIEPLLLNIGIYSEKDLINSKVGRLQFVKMLVGC
jgi:hypothetical protein